MPTLNKINITVAAATLGCKVNVYDTEQLLSAFSSHGFSIVDFDNRADVYIINTCTVTNTGDKKSRQLIRRAKQKNPEALVIVTGCYAEVNGEEIAKIAGVTAVFGTRDRYKILEYVEDYMASFDRSNTDEPATTPPESRCRAYVKIEDGCDRFCSYCIIPYARGRVRSEKPEDVIAEVTRLSEQGYKEVVLIGIHAASYGKDFADEHAFREKGLLKLIQAVHETKVERIRLSSIEPAIVTQEFAEKLGQLPKLCRHFHLSLQSGCAKTLAEMNRRYTPEQYRQAAAMLRESMPDLGLTTDMIVGFPNETDADFAESLRFAEEMGFLHIHVFPYSAKTGTKAAVMKNQIPSDVKTARTKALIELSNRMNEDFMRSYVGLKLDVLFEQTDSDGAYIGHSKNYIPVRMLSDTDIRGQVLRVKAKGITETDNEDKRALFVDLTQ